jgi:ankyrin repeat protein
MNPEATTKSGLRPLHLAAQNGHEQVVRFLVHYGKVDVLARTKFGNDALHLAIKNKRAKVAIYLIWHGGFDPDYRDPKSGLTHFAHAVLKG